MSVIDVLRERGFIDALTHEDLAHVSKKPLKVYCGFDPTADSLHLGNLVAIMGLAWFQRFGHTPVAIMGGATGMIGDPAGKNSERHLLEEATIQNNLQGIRQNLEKILNFNASRTLPIILNNLDWFKNFSFLSFLRDVGKLFRMGPMLAKDSVKTRLQSEDGLSFTEFSYQLLQSYDFLYLYEKEGVTVQLGGSDQWGNITAGTELIRKVHNQTTYGVTFPLLVKSDGQKFGKSEKGAIWLSADKLSVYEFYQYLLRTEDADVIQLLRMLTFIEMSEIKTYEQQMQSADYIPRTAQKRLAEEVTRLVHGEEALKTAQRITENLSPGKNTILNATVLESLSADIPTFNINIDLLLQKKVIDLLVEVGLQASRGDARKLIRNGGVTINNSKIEEENCLIENIHLIDQRYLLLAAGKKNKVLISTHLSS